jgi:hypothetical protein
MNFIDLQYYFDWILGIEVELCLLIMVIDHWMSTIKLIVTNVDVNVYN